MERNLNFATKPDLNGNTYTIVANLQGKTFERGGHYVNSDFVRVARRDLRKIAEALKNAGFIEV